MQNPSFNKPHILTVSEVNNYIKAQLEGDARLRNVFVEGELSDLRYHRNGHLFLSLKDEKNNVLSAVIFVGNLRSLRFNPEEGMKVIAVGRISVYAQTGRYQLNIDMMQPDGLGVLAVQFEQLKKRLEAQGLFDPHHKKPIPKFPRTIGVITSPTGAVLQDIRNVLSRRFPNVDVLLCPTLVQGASAPAQLIAAVELFNEHKCADVIIIGRGGGSSEDLWCFNDEGLANAIYKSEIPIISAVGHETDFTICDFVSDLRAPTPSAAAELAVPDRMELARDLRAKQQRIITLLENRLAEASVSLGEQKNALSTHSPAVAVGLMERSVENLSQRLNHSVRNIYTGNSEMVKKLGAKLEALNPVSVLQRGYAIAEMDGKVINSVKEIKPDDIIDVTLKDGTVRTKVLS